jgi:hypothetical protein
MRKAALIIVPSLVGLLALGGLIARVPQFTRNAAAATPQSITIDTTKPRGPFRGTWTASGLLTDGGSFHTVSLTVSAVGAPAFQITHVTYVFEGQHGTFTLEAQITETLTADPSVLTDDGTWLIKSGTGAYATLHGQGNVLGTVDEHQNVITRTYSGMAQFN